MSSRDTGWVLHQKPRQLRECLRAGGTCRLRPRNSQTYKAMTTIKASRNVPISRVLCLAVLSTLCSILGAGPMDNHQLYFAAPATLWNSQSLHVGNGYMGVSFYGGVEREVLELSEKSIWTGEPANGDWTAAGVNPQSIDSLPEIRRAVVEGRIKDADQLIVDKYLGNNPKFGTLTAIGGLVLEFRGAAAKAEGYRRALDLANALGTVEYAADGVKHSREYFCSYPDKVFGVKLKVDKKGALNLAVGLAIKQRQFTTHVDGSGIELRGEINGNRRPFHIRVKALNSGGSLRAAGDKLVVEGADELVLLVTIATNHRLKFPDYVGEDPETVTGRVLASAVKRGYAELRERHIRDYKTLYDRVAFTVAGNAVAEQKPTDARLREYNSGGRDPGLKVLLFNLGRYLIISSSRPGTLPANLQGVWNVYDTAPWSGNYQSNVNLQEIYWSCGPTALLECQEAYIDWIRDLSVAGREVARRCYGTEGWVSHTTGNIYGSAAPYGGISYAVYPMGAAWHCQHLWEQYAFSGDRTYLKEVAFPLMRDAARFYVANLTEYKGRLIFAPSTSAEHGANPTADGLQPTSSSKSELYSMAAPMQDAQMLWDLFTNTIEAANVLGVESEFRRVLQEKRAKLFEPTVGRLGQLQEWEADIDTPACHHRHISHLYAVCPGRQINPNTDVRLAAAAKKALDLRNEGRYLSEDEASGGNWSMAHRMWSWVRLLEAERANAIFNRMLAEQTFENLLTYQQAEYHFGRQDLYREPDGRFCHFQLDASASVPGFIAEMLLQSHLGELSLLPALPSEFPTGSVKGLRARGGYVIDLEWRNGDLLKAVIHKPEGAKLPAIRLKNRVVDPASFPGLEIKRLGS